ncbi:MAG: TonB family protein [Chlamydiota bacterium]
MYLKFYGLREEPFGVTPDPRFLYASPTYQEAQATLEYGIRSGRGFTALIAKPGMGKTTLLFHLLERYSRTARTAFIFLTQCDSREFLRYLMTELGADTKETDFVRLQEQFGQLLVRDAQAGRKVIAVVDEAQNLDISVLETVRLLSDFETPRAKLLHIILTGQPELADRLASPELLQLRQRISHLVRLEPLSAAEVNRYIDHRLRVAGYTGAPLFTPEARALIVERSEGIPRSINNLCFNALSLGCALSRRIIGPDILAEVSADLDFDSLLRVQQEEPATAVNVPAPREAASQEPATAPGAEAAPSSPGAEDAESHEDLEQREGATGELPSTEQEPERIAGAPPAPAAAATGNDLTRHEPAAVAPGPGPVLVPDLPRQAAEAASAEVARAEVASAEVGNLALRIMPAETVPVPNNGTSGTAPAGDDRTKEPASAPVNGAGAPAGAEKKEVKVDIEALAADCALFGMEAPRRWKRPVGKVPAPSRTNVPQPAAPAVPGNGASARTPVPRMGPAAVQPPAKAVPGKVWPPRPAGAPIARKRRNNPRTMYLAAGASVLLLLLLVWLLGASEPTTTSQAASVSATAQRVSPPADSGSSDAAVSSSDSSVLDVVEELPQPGEEAGSQDTRPAVVMRGTGAGEQLLRRVDPVYPAAARANRIQGAVVLGATIGTHGFLRHIRVLSGDPLLADSVLDAVKGWRYRPHNVRGRTVETETRIVVNFQLVPRPPNSQQSQ